MEIFIHLGFYLTISFLKCFWFSKNFCILPLRFPSHNRSVQYCLYSDNVNLNYPLRFLWSYKCSCIHLFDMLAFNVYAYSIIWLIFMVLGDLVQNLLVYDQISNRGSIIDFWITYILKDLHHSHALRPKSWPQLILFKKY